MSGGYHVQDLATKPHPHSPDDTSAADCWKTLLPGLLKTTTAGSNARNVSTTSNIGSMVATVRGVPDKSLGSRAPAVRAVCIHLNSILLSDLDGRPSQA